MFSLPAIQFRSLPCTGRWWRWSSCTPPRTTSSCTWVRPPSSLRSDLRTWAKWTCISNRNGHVVLTWYHLGPLHTQLRASQTRPPSADTPWRRSPGGEGELFQVNFSWGPSSDAFNTRDVAWLVQHVDALPPFSPELPPLRTSVIWSRHSCALLLTYSRVYLVAREEQMAKVFEAHPQNIAFYKTPKYNLLVTKSKVDIKKCPISLY